MTGWHLHSVLLPDGKDAEDLWITSDGWRDAVLSDAELLPGRFALPGLVDAHSHISFGAAANGPIPLDRRAAEGNLDRSAQDGVGLIREAGGIPEVVLGLPSLPGRPFVVAAGRHLAPQGMYFEAVHAPVAESNLVTVALSEVAAGARWIKLVADFPPNLVGPQEVRPPAEPTYSPAAIQNLITAAHRAGARVAAHVTTPVVGDLVRSGVDSIEHGTGLEKETVVLMAQRGTAWTPTLCAALGARPDDSEERLRQVAERRERLRELLPFAVEKGVPVLTGSDVVGNIPREILLLMQCGLEPADALRAATTTAVRFLGADAAGASPTVVTYDADPRSDPEVLSRPAAVVIGGIRVR